MSDTERTYRTLIRGKIKGVSALAVGGSDDPDVGADSCYRDGLGRLTIPGTGLAGALIETAARVFPRLIPQQEGNNSLLDGRITEKRHTAPQGNQDEMLQSVWRFQNSHPDDKDITTEWRQGVGIRQATGATAGKALYDFEVVPAGAEWDFFLEIDTHRGGPQAEAVAVLALEEWVQERAWLGRGPARGTGWFRLTNPSLVRLGLTPALVEVWPDNTRKADEIIKDAVGKGALEISWAEALGEARNRMKDEAGGTWHYLTLTIGLAAGKRADGYGLDVLQVGGHPAGDLDAEGQGVLRPLSAKGEDWMGDEWKPPDAPFVSTQLAGAPLQPFLPGGGLRGPLRHAASRLKRAGRTAVRDPNDPEDTEAKRLDERIADREPAEEDVRKEADPVTRVFGFEKLSGRLLVSDAQLDKGAAFLLSRLEHHAEDEFTGGVYGHGKFDRTALLEGPMTFHLTVEAPSLPELEELIKPLLPALELAQIGHLPVGGGKWRGAGWVPWEVREMKLVRAGGDVLDEDNKVKAEKSVARRLARLLERTKGGGM